MYYNRSQLVPATPVLSELEGTASETFLTPATQDSRSKHHPPLATLSPRPFSIEPPRRLQSRTVKRTLDFSQVSDPRRLDGEWIANLLSSKHDFKSSVS